MAGPRAYPLKWPPAFPRAKSRTKAQFRTSLSGALKNVNDELVRFSRDTEQDVSDVVISSNVTLGAQNPDDPGVAVYFTWDGEQRCIPIDRYTKVEHNLQAIFHVLDADRTKMRHGGLVILRAAYQGMTALPPPASWRKVLGFGPASSPSVTDVKRRYHTLAKKHHPDQGGDETEFKKIKGAYEAGQSEIEAAS